MILLDVNRNKEKLFQNYRNFEIALNSFNYYKKVLTEKKKINIIKFKRGDIIKKYYFRKNKAFSTFENILSILIISIILNFSFLKYRDFRDLQDINAAKTILNETFFNLSISSLKTNKKQEIKLNFLDKKIIISDYLKKREEIKLPKSLLYYHTYPTPTSSFSINFTKNGNVSKSFSIYIFDRKKQARYKIAFYGFDRNKFLKINNYKKISKADINFYNILKYHNSTNEDRPNFYKDWRKE